MNASYMLKESGGVPTLKACHVTSGHAATDTRILKRECTLLKEKGFDVTLMAQTPGPVVLEGIPVRPLRTAGPRWYQRLLLFLSILMGILDQNYDVVHFHDPDLLPAMLMFFMLRHKPVIWDAHEDYESAIYCGNKFLFRPLSRALSRFYSFLELRACHFSRAKVVTVSETMARRYRDAGIEAIACANYVDHTRIPFPPKTMRSSPPLIIMTGTIQRGYSPLELLEAFGILKANNDLRLALWGDFSASLRDELMNRARELMVEDSVECTGPFPWDQLVTELIPKASVAVYISDPRVPQRRHEIPNRIFEYWVNSVPVVVAKGTLCSELVSQAKAGVAVNYGSLPELVAVLEKFVTNSDLVSEMGENGRRAVLESYNWAREGKKLVDLYKSLIPSGAALFDFR